MLMNGVPIVRCFHPVQTSMIVDPFP
jgi:hypothetical protein